MIERKIAYCTCAATEREVREESKEDRDRETLARTGDRYM